MSNTTAKGAVRIVGSLIGTLSAVYLALASVLMFEMVAQAKGNVSTIPFAVVGVLLVMALSSYGLYVGYLVWFKLSPLAVQHVCGTVAFVVFVTVNHWLQPFSHPVQQTPPWQHFAWLGGLWLVYLLYRLATNQLSRALFASTLPVGQN